MAADVCQKPECPGCPMMRSQDKTKEFCARCDGGALVGLPRPSLIEPLTNGLHSSNTRASSPTSSLEGRDPILGISRPSSLLDTPPTPHSRLASPPLPPQHALEDVDPLVLAARRQQSDRASTLIGMNLLQGWTLLGDECSNEACYGVPLMRRPAPRLPASDDAGASNSAGRSKQVDPRKHCVICGRDYVREQDVEAVNALLGVGPSAQQSQSAKNRAPISMPGDEDELIEHSAAAKKRRFTTQPDTSNMANGHARAVGKGKGRDTVVSTASPSASTPTTHLEPNTPKPPSASPLPITASSTSSTPAIEALEKAVQRLTQHLCQLSERPIVADSPSRNSKAVADAAESLARACKALEEVKRL